MNNSEPIPFVGHVNFDDVIDTLYGKNIENVPKYVVLGDGCVYIYIKDEDRYALCEQAPPLQERVSATEISGGTASSERSGESTLCDGQKGSRSQGEGY